MLEPGVRLDLITASKARIKRLTKANRVQGLKHIMS